MAKSRDIKTLQKFAAIHASIHNHFNLDRHLNCRESLRRNRSEALEDLIRAIPLGRAETPEEAAGAVYLLCLPEADYITGQVLEVSGGLVF